MPSYKTEARLRDVNGRAGKTNWRQIDHAANIIQAIGGMSTASLTGGGWNEAPGDFTQPTSAGAYSSVKQKAELIWSTVATNAVKLPIPAPKANIFGLGGDTTAVDPLAGSMPALTTAAQAVLADVAGNIVTAFVSGEAGFKRRG